MRSQPGSKTRLQPGLAETIEIILADAWAPPLKPKVASRFSGGSGEMAMRKSRFTEAQIVEILKEVKPEFR